MKIENYSLNMHSESTKSVSTTITSFVTELDLQNAERKQETKHLEQAETIKSQMDFFKRLQFQMVQELLERLNPQKYKLKALTPDDFKASNIKQLTAREVTLTKEYKESQSLDVSMCEYIQTATQKIAVNSVVEPSNLNTLLKTV